MADTTLKTAFSLFLAISFFISNVHGNEFTCEQLDRSTCAFAVSSSGSRCTLEKLVGYGNDEIVCRTSGVKAATSPGWVETDECVAACGLNRDTYGIPSYLLLDQQSMLRICSSECYDRCPNVVDLYATAAASDGVSLTKWWEGSNDRREMEEQVFPPPGMPLPLPLPIVP